MLRWWPAVRAPHGKGVVSVGVLITSTSIIVPVRVSKRIEAANVEVLIVHYGVLFPSDTSPILVVTIASILLLRICFQWIRVSVHRVPIILVLILAATSVVVAGTLLLVRGWLAVVVKVGVVVGLILLLRIMLVTLIVAALILVVLLRWRLLIVLLTVIINGSLLIKRGHTISLVQDCESVHLGVFRPPNVIECRCRLVTLGVDRGKRLEFPVRLLVEHETLHHVVGNDFIECLILVAHQLINKFHHVFIL